MVQPRNLALLITLSSLFSSLKAQDTHYWTIQQGTRSVLMGGAVVGGTTDNSAIFYNPASLAFIDSGSISLNATTYQLEKIKIENAIGQQKDFLSDQIGALPLMVNGIIRTSERRLKIGYGLIRPVDFNFKATARIDEPIEIVDDSESTGKEGFIGESIIQSKLTDDNFGIGMGYKLNDRMSIGLTHLFSFRSLSFSRISLTRFFINNEDLDLVSSNFIRSAKYFTANYIPKLGYNYIGNNWSFGLTAQLPSIRIIGSGNVAADIAVTNIKIQNNDDRIDAIANDRQEKLKAKFKTPLALAGGLNWYSGRSKIGITVQYNGAIKPYNIMKAEPASFVRPDSLNQDLGSDKFLMVKTAAIAVVNFAVGYELAINSNYSFNASFRTNKSYYDKVLKDELAIKPDLTSWDIYHLTLGGTLSKGRNNITLGLLMGFGLEKDRIQEGNLDLPNENNFLQGQTTITKAQYTSVGVLLGYSFLFGKKGK